jgi:PmbA protein
MMEKLIEMATAACDSATADETVSASTEAVFQNGELKEISSSVKTGLRLVVVKGGRLGLAYTTRLRDRKALLDNALLSARNGPEVAYAPPASTSLPGLDAYDPSAEATSSEELAAECGRCVEAMRAGALAELSARASVESSRRRLMNGVGVSYEAKDSHYYLELGYLYPASFSSVGASLAAKGLTPFPGDLVAGAARLFRDSRALLRPKGGEMSVLLMPDAFYALAWRLLAGTNARSVYQRISPVAGKVGEALLSDRVSLYIDPHDCRFPWARAFDDEGTPTSRLDLYREGKLRGFYADRNYAQKIGIAPPGCGYADSYMNAPGPAARHVFMAPGTSPFEEMIARIDRGVIVQSILGAHSGNIPNGDFSIGLSPGLYVEGGKVIGHVKDAMISGNAYEAMRRVVDVEDRVHPAYMGCFPALTLEGMKVTMKA